MGARARRDARRDPRRLLARRGGRAHLGARAGPAADRRRLRPGQRLPLPHLLAVGRALVPADRASTATRRCRRRRRSSRSTRRAAHALAWLTGSTLVAGVLISLAAGAAAAWALAEIARPLLGDARRARRRPLPRPLPRRLRAHRAVLGRALPRPRGRRVSRRDARAGRRRRSARRSRDRDAADRARAPAGARVLLWRGRDPRSLARLAPLAAAAGRGRSLRALSRLEARRPVGVHERPGRLEPRTRRRSARSEGSGTRCSRPDEARATCSTCPPPGRGTTSASRSGTSPISPARRGRLADLGRVAPPRRRLRRLLGGHARDRALGAGRGLPARQPPALPARGLPTLPRARVGDARPAASPRRDDRVRSPPSARSPRPPSRAGSGWPSRKERAAAARI